MMTREAIKNQIQELTDENMEDNTREIQLLGFAVENATDDELRIAQLALPGRRAVMLWAKNHMK